jgi:two-component sensor histidine kinase
MLRLLLGDCVESLTLIANELVTNAAKYALAGRDQGEITLATRKQAHAGDFGEDNGTGLTDKSTQPVGFGNQLI